MSILVAGLDAPPPLLPAVADGPSPPPPAATAALVRVDEDVPDAISAVAEANPGAVVAVMGARFELRLLNWSLASAEPEAYTENVVVVVMRVDVGVMVARMVVM